MNVRQCEYVLAVAELKSFGLAAEQCFVTQSTLSTMVGKFEDEIGIKVFDRKTKPITITKEGLEIILSLKGINREIESFKELVESLKGELVGDVKIGVIPTVAPFLLPEFLSDFTRKYPKLNFIVSEMTTDSIENLLEKRELDIGIFAIPIKNKHLVEFPLYDEPFVLYDCTSSPLKEVEHLENVDFSKFWLLEEGHCLRSQVLNICDIKSNKINIDTNFDFRAGSIESLIRFVRKNKGLTLLPFLACTDFSMSDKSKISHFKSPIPARTIGLAVHSHFTKLELVKELQQNIQLKINPLINFSSEKYVVPPLN